MYTVTVTVYTPVVQDPDEIRAELERHGRTAKRHKKAIRAAHDKLRPIVADADAAGIPRLEISQLTGLSRVTLNKWLDRSEEET